jgi:hypothetical protein
MIIAPFFLIILLQVSFFAHASQHNDNNHGHVQNAWVQYSLCIVRQDTEYNLSHHVYEYIAKEKRFLFLGHTIAQANSNYWFRESFLGGNFIIVPGYTNIRSIGKINALIIGTKDPEVGNEFNKQIQKPAKSAPKP